MGREFLTVFKDWAEEYDTVVSGGDRQYQDVFENYDDILDEIVVLSGESVIEFGIGTGNLTSRLLAAGKQVWGVEPSHEMRSVAEEKLPPHITIVDGDMQNFTKPPYHADSIVSSYVFHHLSDDEKKDVLKDYAALLAEGGKLVFADTAFISEKEKDKLISQYPVEDYPDLIDDLNREYYPYMSTVYEGLKEAGFRRIGFTQMNRFVWIIEAEI